MSDKRKIWSDIHFYPTGVHFVGFALKSIAAEFACAVAQKAIRPETKSHPMAASPFIADELHGRQATPLCAPDIAFGDAPPGPMRNSGRIESFLGIWGFSLLGNAFGGRCW